MGTQPSEKNGAKPPIFGLCLLRPNGCMDQDATWYGGRPRPRLYCFRWGPGSLPQKGGGAPSPIFGDVCCGQMAGWIKMALGMEVGLGAGHIVLDGTQQSPPPISGPFLLWPKGLMHQDTTCYGGMPKPRRLCVRWGLSPLPKKGRSPQFLAHIYCGQTAAWIKMPLGTEVGLGVRDIALYGDPASPPLKGHSTPIFDHCRL